MRAPAVSGRFYPEKREYLIRSLEGCFEDGPGMPGAEGKGRNIRGAMVPHAGYMASGPNAAHVYKRIKEDGLPDAYVIIGPDHHGICDTNTFSSESYCTPIGEAKVHQDIAKKLGKYLPDIPAAQEFEHSIEVQIPFIQYIDPDPRIIPVLMSDQSPQAAIDLAHALSEACDGHDVVFIASTDMSHYIPREKALELDTLVLDRIRMMDWRGVYDTVRENRISMCGYGPTAVVMMLCETCEPVGILHTDSYDTIGVDPDAVVGYGSAVFSSKV